jgi:DNA-binding IclR family transcriptional regulator
VLLAKVPGNYITVSITMSNGSTKKQNRLRSRSVTVAARKGSTALAHRVKPISNAIGIIRHLSKSQQPATVTQLARLLTINPSTCFNIVRTLVAEGLVEFDESSKSYAVGLGLMKLVEGVMTESERLAKVKPKMHEIAERHGVTLLLWRRVGVDRMLLISVENSSADLQIHLRAGQRLPLLIGATGRAVAARIGLTKQQLKDKFRSLRWARRISFEDYWHDTQTAAERGWAVDDGYFSTGATTVAAPVLNRAGSVSHSIVAIMFRGQHDQATIKRIAQDLVLLSGDLGSALD